MKDMLYFAYGSNMLSTRLRQPDRAPTADPVGRALLERHRIAFHKRGADGSGKCDAFPSGAQEDVVHGVLYRLHVEEKASLDRVEGVGRGYEVHTVEVEADGGRRLRALTYLAQPSHHVPSLKPFCWYLDLVLAGAHEHRLPPAYVAALAEVATRPDPDAERAARQRLALPDWYESAP